MWQQEHFNLLCMTTGGSRVTWGKAPPRGKAPPYLTTNLRMPVGPSHD